MYRIARLVFAFCLALAAARFSSAATVSLSAVLGNSGYEDDLIHSQWTDTKPNANYINSVPVNPVIIPLDPNFSNGTTLPALTAPAGNNFVGVLNGTLNSDLNGKLAHNVVAGNYAPNADTFEVTVWANRGRLGTNGNTNSAVTTSPPTLDVRMLGFSSVAAPTVTSSNDNWSTTIRLTALGSFTNWGAPGQWTSQTFSFTNTSTFTLSWITLTVTGQNHNHDQYVAWDIGPVPEPGTATLGGFGCVALVLASSWRKWRRR